MMKKLILSMLLFAATFIAVYICLCYLVPSLRIKLFADPKTYFMESIRHMILVKGVVSLVVSSAVASIPMLMGKRKAVDTGL